MDKHINTKFDDEINSFIVLMPENIALEELHNWKEEFLKLLYERAETEKVALLIDSNKHQFESIECLKFLRNFLSGEKNLRRNISRVAFVQPRQCREPEIASLEEAYFSQFEDAYRWLRQNLN